MRKFEIIFAKKSPSKQKEMQRELTRNFVTKVENLLARVEGERPDSNTRAVMRRVLGDARRLPPEKMVAVIRAFKPVEKKEVSK